MIESIKKVTEASTVSGNGTSPAKRKESGKHPRHDDEHDVVSISEEARKQIALENDEEASSTEY